MNNLRGQGSLEYLLVLATAFLVISMVVISTGGAIDVGKTSLESSENTFSKTVSEIWNSAIGKTTEEQLAARPAQDCVGTPTITCQQLGLLPSGCAAPLGDYFHNQCHLDGNVCVGNITCSGNAAENCAVIDGCSWEVVSADPEQNQTDGNVAHFGIKSVLNIKYAIGDIVAIWLNRNSGRSLLKVSAYVDANDSNISTKKIYYGEVKGVTHDANGAVWQKVNWYEREMTTEKPLAYRYNQLGDAWILQSNLIGFDLNTGTVSNKIADTYTNTLTVADAGQGYVPGQFLTVSAGGALLKDATVFVMGVDPVGGLTAFATYGTPSELFSKMKSPQVTLSVLPGEKPQSKKLMFDGIPNDGYGSSCYDSDGDGTIIPYSECILTEEEYMTQNYHFCGAELSVSHDEVPGEETFWGATFNTSIIGEDCDTLFVNRHDFGRMVVDPVTKMVVPDTSTLEPVPLVDGTGVGITISNFYMGDTSIDPGWGDGSGAGAKGNFGVGVRSSDGVYSGGDNWISIVGLQLDAESYDEPLVDHQANFISCANSESPPTLEAGQYLLSKADTIGWPMKCASEEFDSYVVENHCDYWGEGDCASFGNSWINDPYRFTDCGEYLGDLGSSSDFMYGLDYGIGSLVYDDGTEEMNAYLDGVLEEIGEDSGELLKKTDYQITKNQQISLAGALGGGCSGPELECAINTAAKATSTASLAEMEFRAKVAEEYFSMAEGKAVLAQAQVAPHIARMRTLKSVIQILIDEGKPDWDPELVELRRDLADEKRWAERAAMEAKIRTNEAMNAKAKATTARLSAVSQRAASETIAAKAAAKLGAVGRFFKDGFQRMCQVGRGKAKGGAIIVGLFVVSDVASAQGVSGKVDAAADGVINTALQANPYGFLVGNFGSCAMSSAGDATFDAYIKRKEEEARVRALFDINYHLQPFATINEINDAYQKAAQKTSLGVSFMQNTNPVTFGDLEIPVSESNERDAYFWAKDWVEKNCN